MKIIIAGAGEVGTHLAKMLSQEKQDIILMDPNEERLNFTNSSLEILPMVGNPTSIQDLEEAGIRKADLFVGVTPEETTNITACLLASKLGAHKTMSRINNYEYLLPKNKELFEKMGISSMIYPEMLAAREIVSAVKHPWTRQYWELFGGALILLGVKIRDNSRTTRGRPDRSRRHCFFHNDERTPRRCTASCGETQSGSKESHYHWREPHSHPHQPIPSE